MSSDFAAKSYGLLNVINNVKKDVCDCAGEAERNRTNGCGNKRRR